jgi:hypothetical protein
MYQLKVSFHSFNPGLLVITETWLKPFMAAVPVQGSKSVEISERPLIVLDTTQTFIKTHMQGTPLKLHSL